MKRQRSRKSFTLEDSIDEDKRKEEIVQKLISSCTSLQSSKQLPPIKFDLEENEQQPKQNQINTEFKVEYITPQVVQNNLDMVKENLQLVIEEKINDSKCLNYISLLFELFKIMAYCNILIHNGCSNQKSIWFFLMFLHDIIQVVVLIKLINVGVSKFENRLSKRRQTMKKKRESKLPMAGRSSYYGQLIKEIDVWESQISIQKQDIEEKPRKLNYIKISFVNSIFYIFLIIWGLLQLGQYCQSNIIIYTFQIFIIVGTITLAIKFILIISFKCCISTIIQNYLMIAEKNPQNQEIIINLSKQVKKTFEHEICYLCQQQIKQLTVFIDLPCNRVHRFHEKCISQWLQAHLFCPVCAEPVELMNYQMQILQ